MGGHYAMLDIKSHFPQYEYESYFDHENAPYGNRPGNEIFSLTEAGCQSLWNRGCSLILIACNTVSAETLRRLQEENPDKKILGCIIPSCEVAVHISNGKIGLIGTRFTVQSQKYNREIAKLSSSHQLFSLATPELAGFVEHGNSHSPETLEYLDNAIDTLLKHDIDTLILACTHYTAFYEYLTVKYPYLKIVDSARTQTIKL